jgi:integrase
MFEFFFETGARCGETIGLTWQNVDFKNKFVKIDHQLLYELDEEGKRRFQICPPKTIKGIRKIPLTSKALHALRKQKEYMLKHGMIDNHTVDGHSGFVFLTKKFQLWSVVQLDIILHKIVYDYNSIEVADGILEDREPELLPNITAHILRHTACTRMAEAGMDQRTLQEIMGHSNLAITMKVYNHVDDKRMRDEIEKFDKKRSRDSRAS